MQKKKKSGPQLFMHAVIVLTAIVACAAFILYYGHVWRRAAVLWCGIVCFMILYHFWVRILLGNLSKRFRINSAHPWFLERPFEKKLYAFLRVKQWKGKALTYDPEAFSIKAHSLDEIAATMTKAELDHWMNELVSLSSLLFSLLWGEFWIFLLTAVAAMLFDGQFILIQRYNRPKVLRILEKRKQKTAPPVLV